MSDARLFFLFSLWSMFEKAVDFSLTSLAFLGGGGGGGGQFPSSSSL